MATIKSYTDIEQSKKLAEILPIESADIYYDRYGIPSFIDKYVTHESIKSNKYQELIPCWSLAALINILPILDNRSPGLSKTYDGEYRVVYHSTAYEKAILTSDYDNPIDACYEMILKLHELKML